MAVDQLEARILRGRKKVAFLLRNDLAHVFSWQSVRLVQKTLHQPAETELVSVVGQHTVGFGQVVVDVTVAVAAEAFRFVQVQVRRDSHRKTVVSE